LSTQLLLHFSDEAVVQSPMWRALFWATA